MLQYYHHQQRKELLHGFAGCPASMLRRLCAPRHSIVRRGLRSRLPALPTGTGGKNPFRFSLRRQSRTLGLRPADHRPHRHRKDCLHPAQRWTERRSTGRSPGHRHCRYGRRIDPLHFAGSLLGERAGTAVDFAAHDQSRPAAPGTLPGRVPDLGGICRDGRQPVLRHFAGGVRWTDAGLFSPCTPSPAK